jgi:hypothetical protein
VTLKLFYRYFYIGTFLPYYAYIHVKSGTDTTPQSLNGISISSSVS